ncbi:DUF2510 domain-containing protein [Aeromicrobium sp. 179-A 4D2 NHS]|uniref:DUF2510 domain-containing protein n=1 Tax=Aeromicrobium sp. 179-A 4D2 NHS TaxID=3142375 RepID=UPI0039A0C2F4
MSQQRPPAGWYDDPAGSGGRRYWDGQRWTDRVEGAGRPASAGRPAGRDRLPDGFMMLNGQRVPLGQLSTPESTSRPSVLHRPARRGPFVAAAVAIGIVLLFVVSSLFAMEDVDLGDAGADGDEGALYTLEVDSRAGTGVDVEWYDGSGWYQESAVDPGWSSDLSVVDGEVYVQASANDGRDITTCRIVDADGSTLVQTSSASPGGVATCRWTP